MSVNIQATGGSTITGVQIGGGPPGPSLLRTAWFGLVERVGLAIFGARWTVTVHWPDRPEDSEFPISTDEHFYSQTLALESLGAWRALGYMADLTPAWECFT